MGKRLEPVFLIGGQLSQQSEARVLKLRYWREAINIVTRSVSEGLSCVVVQTPRLRFGQ
jgi:hypothetical protein